MRRAARMWSAPLVALAMAATALLWVGCQRRPPEGALYALRLAGPPAAADWDRALPFRMEASGGFTSLPGEADVDSDAVHKATASCHHGSAAPPVPVELRAFYDAENLYLQVRWPDATDDTGPGWAWTGRRWAAKGAAADGLGLLWLPDAAFGCARACHLNDWRMAGDRGLADYQMRAPGERAMDFWIWRAGRGGPAGAVEDGRLTPGGRESDSGKPFETVNSARAKQGLDRVFGEADEPLAAPMPEPGAGLPGILITDRPDDAEVYGAGRYHAGGWTVTLRRALAPAGAGDVTFVPGGRYYLGVALLDGVALDHNAGSRTVELRLVEPLERTTNP